MQQNVETIACRTPREASHKVGGASSSPSECQAKIRRHDYANRFQLPQSFHKFIHRGSWKLPPLCRACESLKNAFAPRPPCHNTNTPRPGAPRGAHGDRAPWLQTATRQLPTTNYKLQTTNFTLLTPHSTLLTPHFSSGFTLAELTITIAVIATVAALAITTLSGVAERAKLRAAEIDMRTIRAAIVGSSASAAADAPNYIADMSPLPGFDPATLRIHCLLNPTNIIARGNIRLDDFAAAPGAPSAPTPAGYAPYAAFTNWNPQASRGWRGPYLDTPRRIEYPAPNARSRASGATFAERGFFPNGQNTYGAAGEAAIEDPWGNPFVIQVPPSAVFAASPASPDASPRRRFRFARIVSAGPDGALQTPLAQRFPAPDARGDDLVLFINRADVPANENE